MKYIDEFRDKRLIDKLLKSIASKAKRPFRFMEVCGGHTMAIYRFGIKSLLPDAIELVSGPGCPVCVTEISFIDKAIAYAQKQNVIVATFGDLMRVPGSSSSLMQEKANGADIRTVLSPLDATELAVKNLNKLVIFLGIGFETTAPGTALAIKKAKEQKLTNFAVLSAHKIMPPAMKALIDQDVKIDGYIAPGHVSVITGSKIYEFIPQSFGLPVVVSGFEPTDMLQSIEMLINQHNEKRIGVEIQYSRAVSRDGNIKAQNLMNMIFEIENGYWRGLGVIPESQLGIRKEFESFDAEKVFPVTIEVSQEPKGCICGSILKGIKKPSDCKLFGKTCTPEYPVGACMVSSEGTCCAVFRYGNSLKDC